MNGYLQNLNGRKAKRQEPNALDYASNGLDFNII